MIVLCAAQSEKPKGTKREPKIKNHISQQTLKEGLSPDKGVLTCDWLLEGLVLLKSEYLFFCDMQERNRAYSSLTCEQRKTCTPVETVNHSERHPESDQHSNLYLFGQKAVHDEDECSLQAVEDGEDVCHDNGVLLKQEGSEHPHQAQYTCLGYGCHGESPGEETEDGGDKTKKWKKKSHRGERVLIIRSQKKVFFFGYSFYVSSLQVSL